MSGGNRRVPVLPPVVHADRWREHAAFRETFLLDFTSPQHNGALRAFGAMLLELRSEASSVVSPPLSAPYVRHELRAAAGDLRALHCFLLEAAEAVNVDSLVATEPRDREELRLFRLAIHMARRVASIADALDRGLAEPAKP